MFVVWSGFGALTALIAVVGAVVGQVALQPMLDGAGLSRTTGLAAGLIVAAIDNWFVGVRLNNRPGRELVDAKPGQHVVRRRRNTLVFLPMQYWSVPLLLLGAAGLFNPANPPTTQPVGKTAVYSRGELG